jgi:hypothetical protein
MYKPFYKKPHFWLQSVCVVAMQIASGIRGFGWDWLIFVTAMVIYGASSFSDGWDSGLDKGKENVK